MKVILSSEIVEKNYVTLGGYAYCQIIENYSSEEFFPLFMEKIDVKKSWRGAELCRRMMTNEVFNELNNKKIR